MLYFITWKQFALVCAASTLLYYLIIILQYYRKAAMTFLLRKQHEAAPDQSGIATTPIMGAVRETDSEMALVNSSSLDFGPSDFETEEEAEWIDNAVEAEPGAVLADKVLLLGNMSDFLEELKTLIRATVSTGDSKENFLVLLELTAERYPEVADEHYRQALIQHLLEASSELPFELNPSELQEAFLNASIHQS